MFFMELLQVCKPAKYQNDWSNSKEYLSVWIFILDLWNEKTTELGKALCMIAMSTKPKRWNKPKQMLPESKPLKDNKDKSLKNVLQSKNMNEYSIQLYMIIYLIPPLD